MLKQLWSKVVKQQQSSSLGMAAATSNKKRSASVAKERLQLILAHERGSNALQGVNFPALQHELLQCLEKHLNVSSEIHVAVKQEGDLDIFEMQVPVKITRDDNAVVV